jgi:hypothetical protein
MVLAEPNVTFQDEDLLPARVHVAWISRAGVELQEDGRRASARFVETKNFDVQTCDFRFRERLPLNGAASDELIELVLGSDFDLHVDLLRRITATNGPRAGMAGIPTNIRLLDARAALQGC